MMRHAATLLAALILLTATTTADAQPHPHGVEIEVEPVAYILDGAGATAAYHRGAWAYSIEVFGLEVPESLHGNAKFGVSTLGSELQVERFFREPDAGLFAGPEIGISRLEVRHQASGVRETRVRYSVGVRGGYRWYTGLGDLYLSPVVGLAYTLNADAVEIGNDAFETGPVTPFATVGIGWSF